MRIQGSGSGFRVGPCDPDPESRILNPDSLASNFPPASNSPQPSQPDAAPALRPPSEEFVQLFTRTQRRLYLFILSQVASTQDAEEILQETNLIVWSKYHQFDVATNFFAWSAQIATYEVLKFRQRKHREKLRFTAS
jgi:hypothetical protein